ncbi:MAG: copper homeostasis protein CutC [Acidobacteriota bacterium]
MRRILLEICCGSIDDAIEAAAGGAGRVELCSALFLGGLTPSMGALVEAKRRLGIPIMFMIRPRAAGFCYSASEFAAMERDAEIAVASGADGLVFGVLTANGRIDTRRTKQLRRLAGERETVFHRAFDVTPDPFQALDELVDLGITRVLTSGQAPVVAEGVETIARLMAHAGDRIQVMPGGGIRPHELAGVVRATGCRQVHVAAWTRRRDPSTRHRPALTFGGALYPPEDLYDLTDRRVVTELAGEARRRRGKTEDRRQRAE